MIVLGSGITGSGRTEYLESVKEYLEGKGRSVNIEDIGPKMFRKADSLRVHIPSDKILDMDATALKFLRSTVFESLRHNVDDYSSTSNKDLLISLHMSFRWKKVLMSAFDYYYLTSIKPDLLVTVIDSSANIIRRIYTREDLSHWRGRLSLKEILIWQDEETFITKTVSEILDKHHYIVPSSSIEFRKPDPRILGSLIEDVERPRLMGEKPRKIRVYLSYPMTHVEDREEFEKRKNEFVEMMWRNNIIVFDPIMVEDHILIDRAMENLDKEEVYIEEFDVTIPVKEIIDAKEYITDSTVERDYKLIDQSDAVVVYYPTDKLSPGVLSEMKYGFEHMKKVYAYFTSKDISPFFRNNTNYISNDLEDLIRRIREDFKI